MLLLWRYRRELWAVYHNGIVALFGLEISMDELCFRLGVAFSGYYEDGEKVDLNWEGKLS